MSQSTPVTALPAPRKGYLVETIDLILDDGKVVPGYREITEDEYMDEHGIEAHAEAVQRRDEILEDISEIEKPPAEDAFARTVRLQMEHEQKVKAYLDKNKVEIISALERAIKEINEGTVGSIALIIMPQVGPTHVATMMPLAPGMYEKSLGILTRLQAMHALNPSGI